MSGRQTKYFPFDGGENLVDPLIQMHPGELNSSLNYENATNGGYRRIDGIERYDGHPSPTEIDKSLYETPEEWQAAVEDARALINPVPGKNAIRGIWSFNGKRYAFRDNDTLTACVMYESSDTGWKPVQMNYMLRFNSGTNQIVAGDTITGGTSGATAVVERILALDDDWSGTTEGKIWFKPATLSGNFQAGESLSVGGTASATNEHPEEMLSFPVGGKYDFVNFNFYGTAGSSEMYGANGVSEAFIFDGVGVRFIETGTGVDTPQFIFVHKKHLFLSFPGGSIQHSSPGTPDIFNAITGASELTIGQECSGFAHSPGDTLAIMGRNKVDLLYGVNVNDWNIKSYSIDSGAIPWSLQTMDVPYFLDDRGVKKLDTSMDYGDFTMNTLSQKIKPTLDEFRGKLNCSLRVRKKDQYRLFFNNNICLIFALDGGKIKGITRCNYNREIVAAVSTENDIGEEILYVADNEGWVYLMDHGTSLDGEIVDAFIQPTFYHYGTPENYKRFMKVVIELQAEEKIDLTFVPEYSYGDPTLPQAGESNIQILAGVARWEDAYWEHFYWDSQALSTAFGYMTGVGKTFRIVVRSRGLYEKPHTLQGATVHFSRKGYAK